MPPLGIFDPAGFAAKADQNTLKRYREAELIHGRVAMLATVGFLVGEKVAEVYWGPAFGGAIENWFAYMLAMVFLLFRPQGLFGERIIERV